MSELIALWFTVGFMAIGGIWAIIKFNSENSKNQANSTKDIEFQSRELDVLKKSFADHIKYNSGQHDELFHSRNEMRDILTRLTILSENFDKRQDGMDKKIDLLLERRAIDR